MNNNPMISTSLPVSNSSKRTLSLVKGSSNCVFIEEYTTSLGTITFIPKNASPKFYKEKIKEKDFTGQYITRSLLDLLDQYKKAARLTSPLYAKHMHKLIESVNLTIWNMYRMPIGITWANEITINYNEIPPSHY